MHHCYCYLLCYSSSVTHSIKWNYLQSFLFSFKSNRNRSVTAISFRPILSQCSTLIVTYCQIGLQSKSTDWFICATLGWNGSSPLFILLSFHWFHNIVLRNIAFRRCLKYTSWDNQRNCLQRQALILSSPLK